MTGQSMRMLLEWYVNITAVYFLKEFVFCLIKNELAIAEFSQ